MKDKTVKLLAKEIHTSIDFLLKNFSDAGIQKTENDIITQNEKEILLTFLNKKNKSFNYTDKTLILQKKTRTILNIHSSSGKNKAINVEIRKKQFYVKENLESKIKNYCSNHQEKVMDKSVQNEQHLNKHEDNMFIKNSKNNLKKTKTNDKTINKFNTKKEKNITHRSLSNTNIKKNIKIYKNNNITNKSSYKYKNQNKLKDEYNKTKNKNNKILKYKRNKNYFNASEHYEEIKEFRNNKKKPKYKKISSLQQNFIKPLFNINKNIVIGETISVLNLANKMAIKVAQVIKTMMNMGIIVTINQIIDQKTAKMVAEKFGHKAVLKNENELEESILIKNNKNDLIIKPRHPIVTIMGHVDHGKTSLLDYIRSSNIAKKESGGITQHIGAYYVKTKNGDITFLDTPGHSAFNLMRARGAKITDIIVLVIAVDDGVMPQTIEAINHAKLANVPIIVAINKIDKQTNNIDNIKKELLKYGILSEEWGGDNQFVNISVKLGIGIDKLLESILLQAEMLELKAYYNGIANGIVIESHLDKGKGPVATIIIKDGILNKGNVLLCGIEYGHIRIMRNELGEEIKFAEPSFPVEIVGLSNVPSVGDIATVVSNEKKAREVAFYRQGKFKTIKLEQQNKLKLENVFSSMKKNKIFFLNIILKTDYQGSCEAIIDSLKKLSNKKININIISSGVGSITETDATLCATSNAIIIGFNVKADYSARKIIKNENLNVYYYTIIYDLIDKIKKYIKEILESELSQKIVGLAEIRNIFKSNKIKIAGCIVTNGIIQINDRIKILRNNITIHNGFIESIRIFKKNVSEVKNGTECGIIIKNYQNIKIGDIIETFKK